MSASKQPSFAGFNEKDGTFTIASARARWYSRDRCDMCLQFIKAVRPGTRNVVAFCKLIEAGKPCEITGIGPEGDEK